MDSNTLVDKAIDKSIKNLEEPKHVLVYHWFKKWKMFKYETLSDQEAYAKFNEVMKQLMQLDNILINSRKSKVYIKDISPFCTYPTFKYVVEVYWRDEEPRNG